MDYRNHVELRQASNATDGSTTTSEMFKGSSTHRQHTSSFKENSEKESISCVDRVTTREDVSLASFAHLDIKKINRKIDLRIVPVVTLLYLLSFLDRGK